MTSPLPPPSTASLPRRGAAPVRRAAVLALAAVVVVAVAGAWLREPLAQDAAYPGRAAALCALVLGVAVAGLPRAHPFTVLGPANLVTGARTMVVALLAAMAVSPLAPQTTWALILVATAAAMADSVDGALARRSGLASRFGARFDMEVDALLILVLAVLVWRTGQAGAWVVASGLLRYGYIAAGWVWPWMNGELPPSRRRQGVCVAQIVGLIVALGPIVSVNLAVAISAAGLALLTWSFAVDVAWLARRRGGA